MAEKKNSILIPSPGKYDAYIQKYMEKEDDRRAEREKQKQAEAEAEKIKLYEESPFASWYRQYGLIPEVPKPTLEDVQNVMQGVNQAAAIASGGGSGSMPTPQAGAQTQQTGGQAQTDGRNTKGTKNSAFRYKEVRRVGEDSASSSGTGGIQNSPLYQPRERTLAEADTGTGWSPRERLFTQPYKKPADEAGNRATGEYSDDLLDLDEVLDSIAGTNTYSGIEGSPLYQPGSRTLSGTSGTQATASVWSAGKLGNIPEDENTLPGNLNTQQKRQYALYRNLGYDADAALKLASSADADETHSILEEENPDKQLGRKAAYAIERGFNTWGDFYDNLDTLMAGLGASAKAGGEAFRKRSTETANGYLLPNFNPLRANRPVLQSSTTEDGRLKTPEELDVTNIRGQANKAYTDVLEEAATEDKIGQRREATEEKYRDVAQDSGTKFAGDVSAAIFGQVPYALASLVPGGAVIAPTLRGSVSSIDAYREAREEGASKEQAREYAGREALNQGVGDILLSGIAGRGQGVLGDVIANTNWGRALARKYGTLVTSPLLKTVFNIGGRAVEEGVEEVIQDVVSVQNKKSTYDPNARVDPKQLVYSGVLGGLTAIAFNAPDIPGTYQIYKGDFDTVNGYSQAAANVKTANEADLLNLQLDILINECNINLGNWGVPVNETDFETRARYEYLLDGLQKVKDELNQNWRGIVEYNADVKSAFDSAVSSPDGDIVADAARIVTEVGKGSEPDSDIIRDTVDRVHQEIRDTNRKLEETAAGDYDPAFDPDIVDSAPDSPEGQVWNALVEFSENDVDADAQANLEKARQDFLDRYRDGLKNRRDMLQRLESTLRNRKAEVKDVVIAGLLEAPQNTDTGLSTTANGDIISLSNPVMMADGESLLPTPTDNAPAVKGEPKYTLTETDYTHTKSGDTFTLLQLGRSLTNEEYAELKKAVRDNGGYWSGYAKGFLVPEGKMEGVAAALEKINVGLKDGRAKNEASSGGERVDENGRGATAAPQFIVGGSDENAGDETLTSDRPDIPQFEVAGESNLVPVDETETVQRTPETAPTANEGNDGTKRTGNDTGAQAGTPRTAPDVETLDVSGTKRDSGRVNVDVQAQKQEAASGERKEKSDAESERDAYGEIADTLAVSDRTESGDYVFSVTGKDGSYRGEIKKKPATTVNGVPIENVRDVVFRAWRDNINRSDMIDDLVNVARNGKLLDSAGNAETNTKEQAGQRGPVAPTPKKRVTSESVSNEQTAPAAEAGEKAVPSSKSLNVLKHILKAGVKDTSIPNGYFGLDGWSAATDFSRMTLTDYDVSSLPQNTRDISGKIDNLRKFISIAQENKSVSKPIAGLSSSVLRDYTKSYSSRSILQSNGFPLTDKVFVNPDFLRDVVEVFPDASFYVSASPEKFSPVYFEAEHGRGLIMPLRFRENGARIGALNTAEKVGWKAPEHESLLIGSEAKQSEEEEVPVNVAGETGENNQAEKEAVNNERREGSRNDAGRRGTELAGTDAGGTGRGTRNLNPVLEEEGEAADGGIAPEALPEAEGERSAGASSLRDREGVGDSGGRDVGSAVLESSGRDESGARGNRDEQADDRNGNERESRPVSGSDDAGTGKRAPVRTNKNNYTFDAADIEYIDTKKPNIADNLEAIRTLTKIERERRAATPEEKKTLARYKGWGGLADIFRMTWTENYRELSSLLTKEELSAARASTINAHYTDLEVVKAMYDGLSRMGLKGGNILEPSMGTGNFFGAMPKSISAKSNLYGVEMDSVTGRIAKLLYPDANITIAPFQDARYKDGQFDVIVGNVPFSKNTFSYKGGKYTLHDYFFVKSLDHLKDGGIMMTITSTGTLDKANAKARDAIARKADLVAAFRLPGGMFETNAGTKVTTDILVFRKRPDGLAQSEETFYSIGDIDGIPVNEYFVRHPENILGVLTREKEMYGSERTQAVPFENADYRDILAKAMKRLPAKIIGTDMTAAEVRIENDSMKSRYVEKDGKIYYQNVQENTTEPLSGKKADMARGYMKIRDAYFGLLNLSSDPSADKKKISQARKTLNEVYDDFVDKFGALGKTGNGGAKSTIQKDSDYFVVSALEAQGENKTFKKSAIFKPDPYQRSRVEHVDSPVDALAASIYERGKVDLDYMEKISALSKDELTEKLSDRIIETPDGEMLPSELYLSGNVREKLEEARKAAASDKRFNKNVDMLKAVVPKDVPPENISVNIGASWIPEKYYIEFAQSVLGGSYVEIKHNRETGQWIIDKGYFRASAKYGNDIAKLLESTMNQKMMQVRNRETNKIDKKATEEIQQRQRQLRDEFAAWIFAAKDRKEELGKLYNTMFNSWRGTDYTELGKLLKFEGVNPAIKLRGYQRTAIARVVFGGNALLAHGVGTGKTFEMIACAMESKRLGITHKNLFCVPNNKVADFQSDIIKLYPNARVMRVDPKDFEAKNRTRMIAALAINDYDIAVIAHTQFRFIPVSEETERAAIQEQLDEARSVLEASGEPNGRGRSKSRSVKQIEKTIQGLESKLKELQVKKRDDTIPFEKLGIDGLFVDEAHNFKNLPFYSSLNIAGVKGGTSQRATDMFMKSNYLRSKSGKIVFATATPLTNTMAEIYNMTRFISPETLKEAGIDSFDAWASIFGEVTSALEVSPDGVHFRKKDRFAKFRNANQMIGMFRQFADVLKTGEVIEDLPVAQRVTVTSEENDLTRKYVNDIADRINRMGGQASKTDNMLLITSDGRAAATDLRLVAKQLDMDPDELDLPGSKINKTVENVLKEYKDTSKIRGTQLIFLNQGLSNDPNGRYSFDLYADIIEKLIAGGVKKEEIVRIDKVDPKKLEDLFEKVRNGDVRVLIGTTMRMGEGLNIQDRIVALHEVMPTNKPSEIEQSEGRAIRHGNMNKAVRIYRYIQEGSFDSYLWQQLERKARFINVAMSGGDVNEIDDVDEFVLNASEAKAIATGNPLLLEKAELDSRFNDLSAAYRVYTSQQYSAQDIVARYPGEIEKMKKLIAYANADAETVNAHPVEKGKISIFIGNKEYTDRKSANEALRNEFNNGKYALNREYEIGSSRGMSILFEAGPSTYKLTLKGKELHPLNDVQFDGDNATKIVNLLAKIEGQGDTLLATRKKTLNAYENGLADAKKLLNEGFAKQAEYDEVSKRLQEVNAKLSEAAGVSDYEIIDEEDESLNEKFKTAEELLEEEQEAAMTASDEDESATASESKKTGNKGNRYSLGDSRGKWGNGNHDKNAEVRSISDLVDEAQRIFRIPMNTGRMGNAPRDAQGVYKDHPKTIRTRRYGDLPSLTHEIGHWFDDQYDLQDSPYIRTLINNFEADLRERGYTDAQIPGESIAEYFREYMSVKNATEEKFPRFTAWLYDRLNSSDRKRLDEFTGMTNAYFAADLDRRAEAQVHSRTDENSIGAKAQVVAEEMRRNPQEYLGALSRNFVRNWFDDLIDLRGFGNTYALAYYEKQARSIAYGRLTSAFTDKNGNVVGKSLADILSDGKIDDRNARAFDEYLIARVALDHFEAAEKGEKVSTLVYADEELNSAESLVDRISRYERDNPSFHDASEELYEYERNLLDLAVSSGLMSEELRDRLNELYPHYVPLFRVMDDKSQKSKGAKRGYADQNTPIAKFKGSGRDIWSPIESIITNTEKFTAACMRNDVMMEFTDFIDNNEGFGWAAEQIPQAKILDFISTDELGKKLDSFSKSTDKLNGMTDIQKEELISSVMDFVGDTLSQWKPAAKQGKRVVSVMRNGQRQYYEVHDEGVFKALTNMDAPQFDLVTKFFGAITRGNKFFYTTSNPQFVFTNPQRDLVTGFISSTTTDNPFKYLADFGKAFADAVTNSEDYQEYVRNGGGYMGSVTSDYNVLKRVKKDVIKQNKSQIKRFMDVVSEIVPRLVDAGETASRLAEWKRALDQGDDNVEAMRKAQEVTVNFARGGRIVKQINQYIPFFMAGFNAIGHNYNLFVNGGDGGGGRNGNNGFGLNLSPEGKSRRHRAWAKWFLTTGLLSLFTWLFNYLLAPKATGESEEKVKEEYDNLSNYNKNAFYNLYIGDGKFIRVKKTQDMSVPSTIVERMAEYYVLDQKDSLNGLADYIFDSILPVNPFNGGNMIDGALSMLGEVSGVGTLVDLARNEDFKGSPIVSSRYQYLPRTEQYKENTSDIWIAVGDALNMSPIQLQYAAEDNLGWAARLLDNLTPYNGERSLEITNKLVTDSVYSTDIINNFYDQKDQYDKASKAYKANPESGHYTLEDVLGAYKYSKIADLYSDLNTRTREEGDNDLSREMRRRTNALIQTVNEEGISEMDRAVLDIAASTGTEITDIAPYIVIPDHISVKVDKTNINLPMDYDDMVMYYTQAQTAFEKAYGLIIQSGYDDTTTASLLVEARKVINKALRDVWGQELLKRRTGE